MGCLLIVPFPREEHNNTSDRFWYFSVLDGGIHYWSCFGPVLVKWLWLYVVNGIGIYGPLKWFKSKGRNLGLKLLRMCTMTWNSCNDRCYHVISFSFQSHEWNFLDKNRCLIELTCTIVLFRIPSWNWWSLWLLLVPNCRHNNSENLNTIQAMWTLVRCNCQQWRFSEFYSRTKPRT